MTSTRKTLRDVLVLGFIVILSPLAALAGDKVTVCHRPPGNPENERTIGVGAAAVPAHLGHGDTLGECGASCGEDGDACAADSECCAQNCSAGICAPLCTADGGRCTDGSECCGGLCSDQGFCSSTCTSGGAELGQPECTFSSPCCPGQGSCIQGLCWTEVSCSLLGDACDDLAGIVCCFDDVCNDGVCVPPVQ